MTEHITNHVALAQGRSAERLKDKPRWLSLVKVFAARVQDLEDALWQLFVDRTKDNATGAMLDIIGRIVGQNRNGYGDDDYRVFINARILANRSSGSIPEVLAVLRTLIPLPSALTLIEEGPASFVVRVGGVQTYAYMAFVATFLRSARAAGVNGILEFSMSAAADNFTWDGTSAQEWDVGHLAAAVS